MVFEPHYGELECGRKVYVALLGDLELTVGRALPNAMTGEFRGILHQKLFYSPADPKPLKEDEAVYR